jgi:hypothetical protein
MLLNKFAEFKVSVPDPLFVRAPLVVIEPPPNTQLPLFAPTAIVPALNPPVATVTVSPVAE